MSERLDRFVNLMRNIFELDKSDLDFGIYRILNIRHKEIEEFLTKGLPTKVHEVLEPFASNTEDIEKRLKEIEAALGASIDTLPESIPMVKEYKELKGKMAAGLDIAGLETDVYSALYNFFNRYYDEGDFISKRRYKEGVYAIPYEGEEVKLYWANQDQYYIKTAENFKDYTFVADGGLTVHFLLVDATTEQNNNKESDDSKRAFMLFQENDEMPGVKTFEYRPEQNEFIVRFVFDVPKDKKVKWLEKNGEVIRTTIAKDYQQLMTVLLKNVSTDKKKVKTLIDKHLEAYVAKNTFDYFIHKDLGGFLRRELDFFIKSEVIHLDDLDTIDEKRADGYLAKVRAVKRVGNIIIDFLAQLENFQKKLWLKKKFIVETNWCITLDKVDKAFWPEIVENKAQMQEWIDMYAIDEVAGWNNPPSVEFLSNNQNLIVDTKHFSTDFKDRLIASFDNLDKVTNGLMINGDNFHVLNLLLARYGETVDSVYIDPPYNTGPSEILYKNNYKDSSWLALMHSRVSLAKKLMNDNCSICVAIDDYAMVKMSEMLDEMCPGYERNMIVVNHHPQGTPKDNVSRTHEYAVIMVPAGDEVMNNTAVIDGFETRAFMRSGTADNNYRTGRYKSFYAVLVDNKTKEIMGFENAPDLGVNYPKENTAEGWVRIYPISKDGTERVWRKSSNSEEFKNGSLKDMLYCSPTGTLYEKVFSKKEPIISNWTDKRYNAGTYGTSVIKNMLGDANAFSYPKSLYTVQDYIKAVTDVGGNETVLDFFAGSGTTGHAIIDLNAKDNGNRRYILVEMGEYFNSATIKRVKKAIYNCKIENWNNGKPINREAATSGVLKYFYTESYEDALCNITLEPKFAMTSLFGDDYLMHYMLDVESEGSVLDVDRFKTPFSYELKITENNEAKERVVDLVETFNYLLGLSVTRQSTVQYYSAQLDAKGGYDGAVRLCKDINGVYGFKQVEGLLPDGRRALIIWRTITKDLLASNAALDAYFSKHRINPLDREFDIIYVNGDNNLENLKAANESWKVNMTEIEFKKRMFEE